MRAKRDVGNLVELGLAATCNSEGAGKWRPGFADFFRDRDAVVLPDNDKPGRAHAAAVAATLAPVARRVRVVELPDLPDKGDVSDWLAAGGTLDELERIVAAAPDFTIEPDDVDRASTADAGAIAIVAGLRHEAADAGLAALHAAGVPFYQRDKSIVRVCMIPAKAATGEVTFTPGLIDVEPAYLARELGRATRWEKFDGRQGKMVRIDPPRDVVEQISDMAGEWPFPLLAGVIGTPTMRPDGSLLLAEGYDEATGLVLLGAPPMPRIAEEPTRQDAQAALHVLDALLGEFPFRDGGGGGSVDRAVALSGLLTPVLRGAMSAAPMHLANAPQPGTGKSYLTDLASGIATGERGAVVSFSPNPEETEKKIIGSALAGHPIIGQCITCRSHPLPL